MPFEFAVLVDGVLPEVAEAEATEESGYVILERKVDAAV